MNPPRDFRYYCCYCKYHILIENGDKRIPSGNVEKDSVWHCCTFHKDIKDFIPCWKQYLASDENKEIEIENKNDRFSSNPLSGYYRCPYKLEAIVFSQEIKNES